MDIDALRLETTLRRWKTWSLRFRLRACSDRLVSPGDKITCSLAMSDGKRDETADSSMFGTSAGGPTSGRSLIRTAVTRGIAGCGLAVVQVDQMSLLDMFLSIQRRHWNS